MANIRILQGDVFDLLPTIPAGSVNCCVTSPPYWSLRSYLPKDHPLKHLELGREKTPAEFIANMVRVFRLVRDTLVPHGTCWLNIGDTYADDTKWGGKTGGKHVDGLHGKTGIGRDKKRSGIKAGNLCLIPQRLMIALQDDGWFVRSVVVWHKPAPMPASLTGWMWKRCRKKVKGDLRKSLRCDGPGDRNAAYAAGRTADWASKASAEWADCPGCKKCLPNDGLVLRRGSWRPTSAWEPVIMLAKSATYFADGEPTKTPPAASTIERDKSSRIIDDPDEQYAVAHDHETVCDGGANLRDVWTIPSESLREKHYAAYPTKLVYQCIASSVSQEGYCSACGMPFVRIIQSEKSFQSGSGRSGNAIAGKNGDSLQGGGDTGDIRKGPVVSTKTTGWRPSCKCVNPTPRPGVVLDPFCGSGRTGIVAGRLGLDFVGCELNEEYVAMGRRLIKADSPLFNEFDDLPTDTEPTSDAA